MLEFWAFRLMRKHSCMVDMRVNSTYVQFRMDFGSSCFVVAWGNQWKNRTAEMWSEISDEIHSSRNPYERVHWPRQAKNTLHAWATCNISFSNHTWRLESASSRECITHKNMVPLISAVRCVHCGFFVRLFVATRTHANKSAGTWHTHAEQSNSLFVCDTRNTKKCMYTSYQVGLFFSTHQSEMGIPIDAILDLVNWWLPHGKKFILNQSTKLSRLSTYTRVHVYVWDDAHQIQRKKRILCWIKLKSEMNSNQIW